MTFSHARFRSVATRMALRLCAGAAVAIAAIGAARADYLYTFDFNALPGRATAASIVFSIENIAQYGDSLDYISGSINGCAPGAISFVTGPDGFGTGLDTTTLCGDRTGPNVDAFAFYLASAPLGVGVYDTIDGATRVYVRGDTADLFSTGGRLTITDIGTGPGTDLPEPATLALAGISLVALAATRRRRATGPKQP